MHPTSQAPLQPEQRFLLLCLRALWDPQSLPAARDLAGREPFDWPALLRLSGSESLSPLLFHVVRDKGVVPEAVERALRGAYYGLAARNALLLRERERILRALAALGVPVLLLKGAALVETAYPNPALRPMVDLDLLVPPVQARAAQGAFAGLGYGAATGDPWPGFSWRYRNAMAFVRPYERGFPFYLGLHTRLYDVPFYERIPVSDWFARGLALPAECWGALAPAAEDHVVYLCGHLALHHRYEPALMRYLDIALLVHRAGGTVDWPSVAARAADWRLVIPVQRTLARVEQTWPGVVPPAASAQVAQLRATRAERWVHDWVLEHDRTPASDMLLALATLPGLGRRARMLLELAIPSPDYMRQRYCPDHPGAWPLAYLRRGGLALRYLVRRSR